MIVLFLHFYIPEYQESVLRRSAATWYRILTPADIVLYIHLGCFQTVAMFVITNTISSLMGWYPVRYFSWLEIVILIPCWYAMILIHARLLPDYDPEKTRQNESD